MSYGATPLQEERVKCRLITQINKEMVMYIPSGADQSSGTGVDKLVLDVCPIISYIEEAYVNFSTGSLRRHWIQ